MQTDELRLVLEAIGGRSEAFGELAARHSPALLGLAYTLTADWEQARDVAQEALLKAYESLSSLQRPERFGSWLRQIAANLARTHVRSRLRTKVLPVEEVGDQPGAVDDAIERSHLRAEVLRCVQALPESQRMAVVLHYLVGLPPADAAGHLGISRTAFDTRLSRGRDALRKEMTHLMDDAIAATHDQTAIYLTAIAERVRAAMASEPRQRVTAAKELALLAARANLPRLQFDLKSHDAGVRMKAARLLGETADSRAAESLRQALLNPDETPAVLAEVCQSLVKVGAVDAAPDLLHLSRNTADMTLHKVATRAAAALSEGAQPATAPADIPVGLDQLREAGIEALLLHLVDDADPGVRVHAIDGLGRTESLQAVPRLAAALRTDASAPCRRGAAEALGAILGRGRRPVAPTTRRAALEALADALSDREMGVQAEAAWSIAQIGTGKDEALRRYVLDRFRPVQEALVLDPTVRRPGPWMLTFPALLEAVGGEEEMLWLARLAGDARILPHLIRPVAVALANMARPGWAGANAEMEAAVRQGAPAPQLLAALGKTQDPSALPFLRECLQPGMPLPPVRTGHAVREHEVHAALRREAALAIARFPATIASQQLREALQAWTAHPTKEKAEAALLGILAGFESAGTPDDAPILVAAAAAPGMPPRVQVSARAAARRLTRPNR